MSLRRPRGGLRPRQPQHLPGQAAQGVPPPPAAAGDDARRRLGRPALPEHRAEPLLGQDAAVVEHDNAVGDIEYDVHVMLDDDDSQRPRYRADQLVHARRFLRAHSGGRLIEQQHLRLGRKRQRNL